MKILSTSSVNAFAILITFTISSSPLLFSQENGKRPVRTIQVVGTAEKTITADKMKISAEVRVEDEKLSTAQEQSKASFNQLVTNLKEIGVEPGDLALEDHSLGKHYRTKNGERLQDGFYSEREFSITLKKADLLEAVYTELAQAKGITVRGTTFSRKDEIEIRREVRTNALKAAREKAIEMAEVYGQKIGKVQSIREGSMTPFLTRNTYSNSVDALMADGSASGKVSITSSVEVVFELTD